MSLQLRHSPPLGMDVFLLVRNGCKSLQCSCLCCQGWSFLIWDRVLCNPGWPGTHYITEDDDDDDDDDDVCVCVCVCVCVFVRVRCAAVPQSISGGWRRSLVSVFCFHQDQAHRVRLACKCFYSLRHLPGPASYKTKANPQVLAFKKVYFHFFVCM